MINPCLEGSHFPQKSSERRLAPPNFTITIDTLNDGLESVFPYKYGYLGYCIYAKFQGGYTMRTLLNEMIILQKKN